MTPLLQRLCVAQRLHQTGPLALLFLAFLPGCLSTSQEDAVRTFGAATEAAASFTSVEFTKDRDLMIQLNEALIRLRGLEPSPLGADDRVIFPDGSVFEILDLDSNISPEFLANAIRAMDAAEAYGAALKAIVDYDGTQDLKEASEKLSSSLKTVRHGGKQLVSDASADAIASIVQAVGGLFLQMSKASAVRAIVNRFNCPEGPGEKPPIEKLAELLTATLDPTGSGGVAVGLFNKAKALAVAARPVLRDPNGTPDLRAGALADYHLAASVLVRLSEVHSKGKKAYDKFKSAHDKVVQVLKDGDVAFDDVREFYSNARDLVDTLRALRG